MIHSFDASILARGKTSPRVLCGYMSLVDQLIGSAKPTSLLDRQGSAKLVKARVNCEPAARFPQRPTPSKRPRFQYLGVLCTAKRLPVLLPSASRSVRSLLHAATEWSLSTTTDLPTRDRHHTRREFSHPKSVQLSSHHRWLQIEQAPNVGTWLATTFSYSRLLFYVRSNLQSLGSFSVLPNCQLLPASFWPSRFAAVRYYLCTGPCSVECSLTHSLIHALPSSQIKPWNSSPQVNLSLSPTVTPFPLLLTRKPGWVSVYTLHTWLACLANLPAYVHTLPQSQRPINPTSIASLHLLLPSLVFETHTICPCKSSAAASLPI
jgi:hypothetical protein